MIEPTTWTEAAKLLREHGAAASDIATGTPNVPVMLIAGGTDLFPNMKRRQFTPQVLISLGRVKGAHEISNGSGLRIAPGATLTCTGTRTLTQADIDAGKADNEASVAGEDPSLLTAIRDAEKTMALVEACYLSSASRTTDVPG